MFFKYSIQPALYAVMALLTVLLAPPALAAVNADQVRGEVLSVDPEYRSLTLHISESGGDRPAQPGSVMTYHIPEDANFEMEATVDSVLYRSYQDPTLDRINPGDTVLVDFEEVAARHELKKVRHEEPSRSEIRAWIQRSFAVATTDVAEPAYLAETTRDQLPKTASALPYLPIIALVFACLALSLRLARQRQQSARKINVEH